MLVDAVTTTVFNYVRRGLFERDKLTVATMLTLKIMINDGLLTQEEVDFLVMSKVRHSAESVAPTTFFSFGRLTINALHFVWQ